MLSTYNVVLVLHLLAVVFVIGPLAVTGILAPRQVELGRAGLPGLQAASRTLRLYAIISLAAPVLGSAMIGLGGQGSLWKFNQFWVSASYALYLVAVVSTVAVALPATRKATAAIEADEPTEIYKGRLQAAAGGAMLAWTVIVLLMVFKPGA